MKPNILIVGPSGSGKSSSLRNCNPENTAILNTEQKALPFKGSKNFKMNVPIPNVKNYWQAFERAIKGKKVENLIVESFTSLAEHQYRESGKYYTGHNLWGNFKEEIGNILYKSKKTDKYVIFTGIDQVLEGANGVEERYLACEGSWKKKVEKEFVIVLYTTCKINEDGNPEYIFITNKQKGFENCSAKSPMGMLPPQMPNDLNLVIQEIEKYYNEESKEEKITK